MDIKEQIQLEGYFIIKNLFSPEEITSFRDEIVEYQTKFESRLLKNAGGVSIPDFVEIPGLVKTAAIRHHPKLAPLLEKVFSGKDYRFCRHNDIGINRLVGWHKDKLNGDYAKYQSHNIWESFEEESHEIVKVLVYLQDHSNNEDGLKVVPGSHLEPEIEEKGAILLRPTLGDAIVFDQRITHRGMERQVNDKRILVSFGFGKNNIFTDEFEKGTVLRQNKQNKQNKQNLIKCQDIIPNVI